MNQEMAWLLAEKYAGEKSDAFFADCKRLKDGEPLAYVIGHVPFLDCQIYLDNHPLIPRPETEFWVEKTIDSIRTSQSPKLARERLDLGGFGRGKSGASESVLVTERSAHQLVATHSVLDLCAGSGCIGVAVAKALPEVQVDFAEIDPHLLPTIEKNLKENMPRYSNRLEYYRFVQSDLFQNITDKYDLILSNPPYIDPALDRTEVSVKQYEPHQALYGGTKGLEIIDKILNEAPHHLTLGGQLWLEHEPEQTKSIQALAAKRSFAATTHHDQYGLERYTVLVLQ